MTIKQLCRKRNKLVVLSSKIKGEEKKSVELAIHLIDLILDDEI
jgi:ribosomal protein L30E